MVLLATVGDATTRRRNVLQVVAGDAAFSGR
jgi:hypothetical protein